MQQAVQQNFEIPAHVPPHLVHPVDLWEEIAAAGMDAYAFAATLHSSTPPIFYAPKLGFLPGHWIPRRAEDLRRILRDTETFSSDIISYSKLIGETWQKIPNEVDPPQHTKYRALINPLFTPKRIAAMEADIRQVATGLLDRFAANGECDFIGEFADWFPTLIFLKMMEWPIEEASSFVSWTNIVLKSPNKQDAADAVQKIIFYLRAAIAERRVTPGDDFTGYILSCEIDGRKLTDDEVLGFCYLIFIGGLDTVASSLGFFFMHLARHPEQQAELRANPEKIPNAVEELLRAYSVVNMRRIVRQDVQIGEAVMRAGDYVLVSTELGGLDPEAYDSPGQVDFNREEAAQHIAFGYGPHRCVGSHLARRELAIALELWLTRIPFFRMRETPVSMRAAGVFGIKGLRLEWDAR